MRLSGSLMVTGAALCAALVLACGDGDGDFGRDVPQQGGPTPPPSEPAGDGAEEVIPAEAQAEAEQIFQTNCATCHGKEGRGDGPGAAGLPVQPRNFHDPEWQASTSDERIEKVIVGGGVAVPDLSPQMPGNPQLAGKPQVVAALREHIRGLAPEGAAAAADGSGSEPSEPEESTSGGR